MDLAKAAIERMELDVGLDVDIESEAPPGSGLGGSSALVTAVVAALACLRDRALTREEVARLSYAIEREDLHHRWLAGSLRRGVQGCNLIEFARDGAHVTTLDVGPDAAEELQSTSCSATPGRCAATSG